MLLAYPSDAAGKARPTPQAQIVLSGAILVPHGVNPSAVDSYGTPSHAEENLGGFKSGQPVFRNIKDNDISESGLPIYFCDWRAFKEEQRPLISDVSLIGLAQGDSPAPAMQGARVIQESTINRAGTYLIPRNRGSFDLKPFDEVYVIPRIRGFSDSLFKNESEEVNTFVIVPAHDLKKALAEKSTYEEDARREVHGWFKIDNNVVVWNNGAPDEIKDRNVFDIFTAMGMEALGEIAGGAGGAPPGWIPPPLARGIASGRGSRTDDTGTSLLLTDGVDLIRRNWVALEWLLSPLAPYLGSVDLKTMKPVEALEAYMWAYRMARSHIYNYFLGVMVDCAGKNEHVHVDLRIGYKPVIDLI